MRIEEVIQAEYQKVVREGLPFEFISSDTHSILRDNCGMQSTRVETYEAMVFIRQYRMIARRSEYRLQEGRPQPQLPHARSERERELQEHLHQKMLVRKLLVSNWYFKQAEAGVNKLFLKLESVS